MLDSGTTAETAIQRATRIRVKLLTSILNTLGLGVLAATMIQPLLNEVPVTVHTFLGGALGLLLLTAALYIAPRGEPK